MDRDRILEASDEEGENDEEMSWDSDSDEESGGGGSGDSTRFDALCDGVLTALSMVHGNLDQLLDLKNEILRHTLPTNVLTKTALICTKVFRSLSDLHMPVNELIRLVRIYSTPWEEKSTALEKLHHDYESKKTQLNVALKKLQLIDAQTKKIMQEKRIMNWEKVFAKLLAAKGHGRNWKFRIQAFKKKAKLGPEALRDYLAAVRRAQDSDSDSDEQAAEDTEVETQMQQVAPSDGEHEVEDVLDKTVEGEEEEDVVEASENEVEPEIEQLEDKTENISQKEEESPVQSLRPPMRDQECWTHEPEFDRYLHIRVYHPEGLEANDVTCVLSHGKQFYKTGILDGSVPVDEKEEGKQSVTDTIIPPKPEDLAARRPSHNRGLIGSRGDGVRSLTPKESSPRPGSRNKVLGKYEECVFELPEEEASNIWKPSGHVGAVSEHLRIALHHGPEDEMVAMATIQMEDLDSLDLPVVFMSHPEVTSDSLVDDNKRSVDTPASEKNKDIKDKEESSVAKETIIEDSEKQPTIVDPKQLQDYDQVKFPLYSIHTARGDSMHMPVGQLPLVCYWAKRLRPRTLNKTTESETVREIVLDTTGFDLDEVCKEDLHKEMREECLSAIPFTPEPTEPSEEMIPKADYDKLMNIHRTEMEDLQEEYELRIQELLQGMEELQEMASANPPRSQRSGSGTRSASSIAEIYIENLPDTSRAQRPSCIRYDEERKPSFWGETLPKNFFERLRLFEAENQRRRQELTSKTNREVSEVYEKKLAGEHKLATDSGSDMHNAMQDVSLPAVFMPTKNNKRVHIYNPRAAKYFHATGSTGQRLTQPPSMVQLPPLPKNKVPVVNLFGMSNSVQRGNSSEWLINQYLQEQVKSTDNLGDFPATPSPSQMRERPSTAPYLKSVISSPQPEVVAD